MSNRMVSLGLVRVASIFLIVAMLFSAVTLRVFAATATVETTIQKTSDGQPPFDANTYDQPSGNFGGEDAANNNNMVRSYDYMNYKVEISLNNADSNNLRATVDLADDNTTDEIQTWDKIPTDCLTAGVTPVSQITNSGHTLICNYGNRIEGTKFTFTAVARVNQFAKQNDKVWATVSSQADTSNTAVDTSKKTLVTTSFKVDLVKTVPADPASPTYPDDYSPDYNVKGPTGQNGALVKYFISLQAQPGSELIQNTAGLKNFSLVDTFVDNRPVANSSSNGILYGSGAGNASWTAGVPCTPVSSSISSTPGDFFCTQPGGPGQPINITLNNTNVTFPSGTTLGEVFKFAVYVWVPLTDITSGGFTDEFLTNSVTGINGITSITNLQNYGGVGEPLANNSVSAKIFAIPPGSWSVLKTFDGNTTVGAQLKTGGFKAALNEVVTATMQITDTRTATYTSIACDNIDTTSFTFAGLPSGAFQNAAYRKLQSNFLAQNYNPGIYLYPATAATLVPFNGIPWADATQYGATVEYSSQPHTINWAGAEPQRNSTCEDDLDGNPLTQDWFTSSSAVPGGTSAVTKVRVVWTKDYLKMLKDFFAAMPTSYYMFFSYNLQVKNTVTIGSKLPNYAVGRPAPTAPWQKDTTSSPLTTDPGYSFQLNFADRVTVVGATMGIDKQTVPNNFSEVKAGQVVEYSLKPSLIGTLAGPVTLTLVDTLPTGMTFIPGTVAISGTNGTLASIPASGSTLTFTLNNVTAGLPVTSVNFKVTVDPKLTKATFDNRVTITSSNAQVNQDSDASCVGCTTPVKPSDLVRLQLLPPGGYNVRKLNDKEVYEVNSPIKFYLRYSNSSSNNYTAGNFIDVLPYNEDQAYDQFRDDPLNTGDASKYHEFGTDWLTASASQKQPGLASVPTGTNGETFQYTTANPTTINHDPCHSSNQASGFVPTVGHYCYDAYILNNNKFKDNVVAGTGATVWTSTAPTNLKTVTAIRWNSTAHNAGSPARDVTVTLNPKGNYNNNVYCNSFAGRIPEITLDVISNDVCAKVVSGTISGTVWEDQTTNNGTLQPGDIRLAGKVIQLFDSLGNTVLDPVTGLAITAVTDVNGYYEFKNLKSGTYKTQVQAPPAGRVQTYDYDNGINAATYTTPNNSGNIVLSQQLDANGLLTGVSSQSSVDYGYGSKLTLGNKVWFDTNNNGIVDVGENGINGVTVNLYAQADDTNNDGVLSSTEISAATPTATTTTSNDARIGSPTIGQPGYYQFANLAASKYFVTIPASNFAVAGVLSGTQSSPTLSGVADTQDDNKDHGNLPTGGTNEAVDGVVSVAINLAPATEPTSLSTKPDDDTDANTDTTIDFGFWQKYSLGNRIWYDSDNSGTINGVETGVPGVTVNLLSSTGTVLATTITDASGYYRFDNLNAGDYKVQVDASAFGTSSPLYRYVPSTNGLEINPNTNGDSNNNIISGTQAIGFTTGIVTLGTLNTEPAGETDLAASGQGAQDKFANMTLDLGFIPPAHIGDTVFFDQNNNGIQDTNEPGIPNATITLTEAGPNGILGDGDDVTIGTQTTNTLGKYDFFSLTPGKYKTVLNTASVPNSTLTTPAFKTVTLGVGQDDLTHDYGLYNPPGQFGDLVWYDYNKDGIKQVNEPGIGGVQVEVFFDANGNGLVDPGEASIGTQTTNSSGSYNFTNLLSDDNIAANGAGSAKYVAQVVTSTLPIGVAHTILGTINTNNNNQNATNYGFTLTPAQQSNQNGDFGYIGNASYGDKVWFDINADGVQDAGEPPVSGVPVTLTWAGLDGVFGSADDLVIGTQTTSVTGNYLFSNLLPGNYRATPNITGIAGATLTTPANVDQTIVAGQSFVAGDFGIKGSGTIGNQLFVDTNQNGIFNTGEPGVAGVTIKLYYDANNNGVVDVGESVVAATVTGTNGTYQFSNLPTDDTNSTNGVGFPYIIIVDTTTLPAGSVPTVLGIPSTENNSQNQAGTSALLTNAITSIVYADFGYAGSPAVSIAKTIYKGHSSGAGCATALNELVIVDKNHNPVDVTYCFAVTNTGNTYLDSITIADPTLGVTETSMTQLSGALPLAPGATQVWYYDTAVSNSITNIASTSGRPVTPAGAPTTQPNVTANDPAGARLIYVFDPPFGIKTGTYKGNDIVRWTMVWINNSGATANGVEILDEPPVGTTYNGNLVCTPRGSSVVLSCGYEASSTTYPRGRVLVTANIAPNLGVTDPVLATNALEISFDNLVPASITNVSNQGILNWDPNNDPPNAYRVFTKYPTGNGPTTLNLTLARTGKNYEVIGGSIFLVAGTIVLLGVWRRKSRMA